MNRIFALVLLLAICAGSFFFYQKSKKEKSIIDGSYSCDGCLTPEQSAAYAKYNRGESSEPKFVNQTASVPTASLPQPSTVQAAALTDPQSSSQAATQSSPEVPPAAPNAPQPPDAGQTAPLPVGDTVPPNPPNGLRFGSASGHYQWYRQGNLTWRVNTDNGSSCIVYATMQEWRKRIVLQHGCGTHA